MFLPLGDDYQKLRLPIVTLGLIILNTLIYFLVENNAGYVQIVRTWGYTPSHHDYVTILTSMFLHGGVMHLVGNMIYLWIAASAEDVMGSVIFLIVYLAGGCGAALFHGTFESAEAQNVPLIGASGAIAAMLGAYIVVLPYARLRIWYWFWVKAGTFWLNSVWGIGFWFLLQITSSTAGGHFSGVAYLAHVGGFMLGAGVTYALARAGLIEKRWERPVNDWDLAGESETIQRADPTQAAAAMHSIEELGEVVTNYPLDNSILNVYYVGSGLLALVSVSFFIAGVVNLIALAQHPGIMSASMMVWSFMLLGIGGLTGRVCFNTVMHIMQRANSVVLLCANGLQWRRGGQIQAFRYADVQTFTENETFIRFLVNREPVEIPKEYLGFEELVTVVKHQLPFRSLG